MFKRLMTTCPTLALPNFTKSFELQCDALGEGIRAILMQEKHPIQYESRKLKGPKRIYSIYDNEMLAIMHALANFRKYLTGSKFIVK